MQKKCGVKIISQYRRASKLKKARAYGKAENAFWEIIEACKLDNYEIMAGAYFHLGEIYLAYESKDKAQDCFSNALSLNPIHKVAGQSLFDLYTSLPVFPLPFHLSIDVSKGCNLSCIYCPEGQKLNEQPKRSMRIGNYKKLIGPLLNNLKRIDFINWSEPLLNDDLFEIIRFSLSVNPDLIIWLATNGMLLSESISKLLAESGVCWVSVSISGLSNEIHQRYHVGSNIEKVFKNIKYFLQLKSERETNSYPFLFIDYLEFDYNKVELDCLYRSLYKLLGINNFKILKTSGCLMGSTLERGYRGKKNRKRAGFEKVSYLRNECFRAFSTFAIRCDGAIFPCCAVHYDPKYIMGDLKKHSFEEAWNSNRWKIFREEFKRGTNSICNRCRFFFPDN